LVTLTKRAHRSRPPRLLQEEHGCLERGACSLYRCRVHLQGNGVGTAQWGLMVGSVFELLLTDLEREGWNEEAAALQVSQRR